MGQVQLYGLSRSVYTRVARLALVEKGVEYLFEEVEIFGEAGVPHAYLRLHPFGRIPTLVDGDFQLYETGAITRYVDEAFAGPPLQPTALQARARLNQIISLLDSYAYRPMVWDVFVQRISRPREGSTADEAVIAAALPKIRTCLTALTTLSGAHRFLVGDELTLADLHAFPMLLYFAQTAEGQAMLAEFVWLQEWFEVMQERSSVQTTKSIYG